MPTLDTYRKQAKLLMRWHREQNYSLGGKVRQVPRLADLTDRQVLDAPFPLALAQEVVAAEAGFDSWAALKAGAGEAKPAEPPAAEPVVQSATPIFFVSDVTASAAFYRDRLGFEIDFLHGKPAFYGSVSRGGACLHLRHVDHPGFAEWAAREESVILATIEVQGVKALFDAYAAAGVAFAQKLTRQAWGGLDFQVRDPDGNVFSFVEYRR
ncbi:putative glyoxalase superfamily protein PhnB [Caulobacter ginsengisoli]|uniref:Glyoxalase superfamily protein PhnB n=1 Tax=Caulobacter ginsengisoli TaxID=400775 RepID=A0ABU0IPE2_9CAUL|nr:glyoxalase superfamily protein [Caulobacter ginsengisoli]MDQ0463261.1 putative glyoxalase superfamily protein PhnB [Caulobacter ginsengisoli]